MKKKYVYAFSILIFILTSILYSFAANSQEISGNNAPTDEAKSLKKGQEAYKRYCSACHGKEGKGDGGGGKLSGIPPNDLTDKSYMSLLSDEDLYKRIRYGEEAVPYMQMPGFDSNLTPETIHSLVKYIRTLEKEGAEYSGLTPAQKEEQFKDPSQRGKIYYMRFCSPCHGVSGDGKGWAAKRSGGTPVAHNDPIVMSKSTRQQIFEHVRGLEKNADRNMPVFSGTITPNVVKDISNYTKSLTGNL
jgi:mono/diheme cytochrome c family protein